MGQLRSACVSVRPRRLALREGNLDVSIHIVTNSVFVPVLSYACAFILRL